MARRGKLESGHQSLTLSRTGRVWVCDIRSKSDWRPRCYYAIDNVWPALGRYKSSGDVAGEQIHGDHDQLACPLDNGHIGLLFVSVQSKHRNSLFRYRSETIETNVLFRIVPKLVSVPVSVVSNRN